MTPDEFLNRLNDICPSAVTLAERNPVRLDVHVSYDQKHYKHCQPTSLPPSILDVVCKCSDSNEAFKKINDLHFGASTVTLIESATRDQGNFEWKAQRQGRLTASKFFRIQSRMKTCEKNAKQI